MARQERPVDPTAGPLQALAYDLRKLRVEAGSPTYRALARKTGYSASTLSEAAGGNRRPTLDVLLAYVGALNGDQEAWRERWTALDGPPAPATVDPPARAERSWRSPRVAFRAGLAVAVVAAGALTLNWRPGPAPSAAAVPSGCPAVSKHALFTARTYGSGATIRDGAGRVYHARDRVPAGCTIGLVGFCIGEMITDDTAGTPDVRWFRVDGGGVVASAIVHGNPPDGTAVSRCPGDRPGPAAITLRTAAAAGTDAVTLTATGRGVQVVGYAAYYADDGEAASWHQIALTRTGLAVRWDRPAGVTPVLAAAACLGGEAPTGVLDLAGDTSRLAVNQRTAAGRVACLYPVS
ncbi:helix-turn-helix transcriptional regulator [Actinoplanes sp. TBRC 11911]|uniref:helix-turn-helix domain-containing protein n=1 Tax=Actinoplanes sp. TBRC 11911 TaxID=2729386 RepID=UPI00145DCFC2|nr:helix-turn-helix transcriptional regulator [Actinoplanes sp. TBRC 11911]NMO49796.1 helix-turn-helix transcriptional regulator [Actinoplanes sp. TBRC 11911]